MGKYLSKEDPQFKSFIESEHDTSSVYCAVKDASAPSAIDAEDMTTIYRIPNEKYQTRKDVLKDRKYELLNKIDEGGFAMVYLAKNTSTNTDLACKVIDIGCDTNTIKLNDVKNELFVLEKIKHPHVIRLHDHFIINDFLFIFMDFANYGNMFNFLQLYGALSETVAKKPFSQIVSGVGFMHAHKIAHRDIKLSNILLNADGEQNLQILITDFGLSRVVYRSKTGMVMCKSYCGTPNYMAPEMKRRQWYNAFMVDIYALGILLFVILNSMYPFNSRDDEKALKDALALQVKWRDDVKLSNDCKKLILGLIEPNPQMRMTMRDLITNSWYAAEMNDIKSILPPLDSLSGQVRANKKFSSPADDIRLRESKNSKSTERSNSRKSSSRGNKSGCGSSKRSKNKSKTHDERTNRLTSSRMSKNNSNLKNNDVSTSPTTHFPAITMTKISKNKVKTTRRN